LGHGGRLGHSNRRFRDIGSLIVHNHRFSRWGVYYYKFGDNTFWNEDKYMYTFSMFSSSSSSSFTCKRGEGGGGLI